MPSVAKRQGRLTEPDKELIARVVLDQPAEMRPAQVNALAKALRRSRAVIKTAVDEARENFAEHAGRYVDIHKEATEAALADGDNETALKGAQWAINHISLDGSRLTDRAQDGGPQGSKILIGIKLGGMREQSETVDIPAVVTETE